MLQAYKDRIARVLRISRREIGVFKRRPLLIFCMLVAPIFVTLYFTSLMEQGLPDRLPTGLVDEDDSPTTRQLVRILSSMKTTGLDHRYATFSDARRAMQKGEIYAFFYIPKGTTEQAIGQRQPKISFYTADTYYIPAALLMKDLKTLSELSGLAVTRETLSAKGVPASSVMGILQPIVMETHPLSNPYLNYGILLNNLIIPGIVIILIMITTTYTIGMEWKIGTQKSLLNKMGGGSVPVVLTGKLLPQTILYTTIFIGNDIYLYRILGYPCQCGLGPMFLLGFMTVLTAQAMGVSMFGVFVGQMRMAMSGCALLGVLSISMAGFSYPVPAMTGLLQNLSYIFPLRNYFLIYANQAVNGYSIIFAWKPILAMLIIMALPLLFLRRYRNAFNTVEYKP